MERLIKNVDQTSWNEFKEEAALHKMRLPNFLAYLVKEHKRFDKKKSNSWDYIICGKRHITASDAFAMKNSLKIFEKELDFE